MYNLGEAVDGSAVQPLRLVGCVLHLETRLDVLKGAGDEGDGPAGHGACHGVSKDGQPGLLFPCEVPPWVEHVLVQKSAVDAQGAQHDRVHEHPAHERGRGPLVYALDAFIAQRLQQAVDGAPEVRLVRRLQSDFDGIEAALRSTGCGGSWGRRRSSRVADCRGW